MRLTKRICSIAAASVMMLSVIPVTAMAAESDDGMNMFEHSDFIEKEQPELDEETKRLISLYQKRAERRKLRKPPCCRHPKL